MAALWSLTKENILNTEVVCTSIDEVRVNIDSIDKEIVGLLAERGGFVKQAARFKKTTDDVKAPQRVEQVITKVRALAAELGGNPEVTEAVYRSMISAFISAELQEHADLASSR
jgi:isochorismate pyruvate lyase